MKPHRGPPGAPHHVTLPKEAGITAAGRHQFGPGRPSEPVKFSGGNPDDGTGYGISLWVRYKQDPMCSGCARASSVVVTVHKVGRGATPLRWEVSPPTALRAASNRDVLDQELHDFIRWADLEQHEAFILERLKQPFSDKIQELIRGKD